MLICGCKPSLEISGDGMSRVAAVGTILGAGVCSVLVGFLWGFNVGKQQEAEARAKAEWEFIARAQENRVPASAPWKGKKK